MEVIAQFQDAEGNLSGPPLSLPISTTHAQLEELLNNLLSNEDHLPYSFTSNDTEILNGLEQDLFSGDAKKQKASKEVKLKITYCPQAVFRVHPVTRCSSTLHEHKGTILALSFSPDGKRLATGAGDNAVRFYDTNTETPSLTGSEHKSWVQVLAWSPCGKYLASGGMDGTVRIWNGQTGAALAKMLTGHTGYVTSLAWEPTHLAHPTSRLASASKDGTVKVWHLLQGICQYTFSSHTAAVSCVKWRGDGLIVSASRDRTLRVWSAEKGVLVRTLTGHAHWVTTLALSTEHVLRTGAFDHEGKIREDVGPLQAALERYQEALKTSGGAERMVSGSDDHTMLLWCLASSPDKPIARLVGHQNVVNQVAFSPDGRYLASASFDRSVKLWQASTGTFLTSFRGHVGSVYQVCWSADSRLVMSAGKDSTLKVWDVKKRALRTDLPGHLDEVYAVDWSPIGDRAASGGKDQKLRLWRQ